MVGRMAGARGVKGRFRNRPMAGSLAKAHEIGQLWLDSVRGLRRDRLALVPLPIGRQVQKVRRAFDLALARIHYAGPCSRVGRCMRLFISHSGSWAGGVVLGSTFPNVGVRDEALGLKRWCRNHQLRELRSPWARENRAYWGRLQRVVNHARTFVFPDFQGRGIGIRAHRLLLGQGVKHWEARYGQRVAALDTLCDSRDSGLFLSNGWTHVGKTAGYESDRSSTLVPKPHDAVLRNNVALRRGRRRWEVWVRVVDSQLMSFPCGSTRRSI